MAKVNLDGISLSLPFGIGGVSLKIDDTQRQAAWELYVELATRITTQELKDDHGTMRGALSSLYSLFAITREILRKSGPDVANGPDSLGVVAVRVLNEGLRPFTAKWHPFLEDYEEQKPKDTTQYQWEQGWSYRQEFRDELRELQAGLAQYVIALGKISGAVLLDSDDKTT